MVIKDGNILLFYISLNFIMVIFYYHNLIFVKNNDHKFMEYYFITILLP